MKLSEVAQKLSCRLEGAPDTEIHGIAGIEHAEPAQITFLANRRYFPLLKTTRASAVLIEDRINLERDAGSPPIAALRTPNPYLAFAHAIELFYQPPRRAAQLRHDLPRRENWRQLLRPCTRRRSRILPHRPPCHSPEWRGHRRRRSRLRQAKGRHVVQNAAVRSRRAGR